MQAEIFRCAHQEHYERMYKGIFRSILKIQREVNILIIIDIGRSQSSVCWAYSIYFGD